MLHDEKAGYTPAEFEKIMPPAGFNDITRGMYELFSPLARSKSGLPSGSNPLSWRVLPANVLPAPGVCVTEQANIYIAHDLTAGMTLADFRRVDFYLKFARVVGIPLHEIAHWLFSPDDWAAWVKRMNRRGRHIGALCVLFEEPRIENQLLQKHYRGTIPGPFEFDNARRRRVSGLMSDEMVAAMHATSDEHMSRNVAQSGEDDEASGLTVNYFNKAMILVYGRVVGGSAVQTPGSLTATAVLTLRAVVAEALEAKHADDVANGMMDARHVERIIEQWWHEAERILQQAVWQNDPEVLHGPARRWSDHVATLELPKSMPEPPPPPDAGGDDSEDSDDGDDGDGAQGDGDDGSTPQADPGDTTPPDDSEPGGSQEQGENGQEQGQEPSDDESGPGDPPDDSDAESGSEGSDGDSGGESDGDSEDESDEPGMGTGEPGDSEEADGDGESDQAGDKSLDGDEVPEGDKSSSDSDSDSGQVGGNSDGDAANNALNDLKNLIDQMRENGADEQHDFEDDKSDEQKKTESETTAAALEKVDIKRGEVASNRRTRRVSASSAWNGRRSF